MWTIPDFPEHPTKAALVSWGITTLTGAFVGSFLGGYLKTLGMGVATKQDFENLRERTEKLTETTKNIESQIEDQRWDRQRRWELKRDLFLDLIRKLTEANDAIYAWNSELANVNDEESISAAQSRWRRAYDEFGTQVALVELISEVETQKTLMDMSGLFSDLNEQIYSSSPPSKEECKELDRLVQNVKNAVRLTINK